MRRSELDPPITTKTLERWERGDRKRPLPKWRLEQLAAIYGVRVRDIARSEVPA